MITCHCTCNYCGHSWKARFWGKDEAEAATCPRCSDPNLTIKPIESSDVYGYGKEKT